jgi:hypothetical protein
VIYHHTTPLVQRGENIVVIQNQFVAAINMKHEDGGKKSEVQPIVDIQTSKLKGNENNSDLKLQGKMDSKDDKTSAAMSIDLTQSSYPDSIHSQVKSSVQILRVDNICSCLRNFYSILKPCDTLHDKKFHHVQLITHAEFFRIIVPSICFGYTMLDKPVDINEMIQNVSMLTSIISLNNVHSCKLTFNLIIEHVVDKFLVSSMCITCDKLAEF